MCIRDRIIDNGVNGKAEPGDRIRLTATISNTQSADYEGMQIVLNNDPRVTFVTASFKSTPVAVNDLYAGTLNTISVSYTHLDVYKRQMITSPSTEMAKMKL